MKKDVKNIHRVGISLIVLVITIIIVIILVGAVILNLTKNNPVTSSKEAVFKNDLATISDQLTLYKLKQSAENLGIFDYSSMNGKVSYFVISGT